MENFIDELISQPFYWGRVQKAWKSWCFRTFILTDLDLENKVPKNNLGIYSTYCDKSQWSRRGGEWDGVQNFWIAINEGYLDMTEDFFS